MWKQRFREQFLKANKKNVKVRGTTSEHRYLETMIVADKKFMQYHKQRDLETYILTIMNMVRIKTYLLIFHNFFYIHSDNFKSMSI